MKNQNLLPIIGIEVHVELKTRSKMFCRCPADHFRVKPNTHTCPVCLGLPGALPVPNQQAVAWTVMLGLALNCQIASLSKFDRKNYFYPDLPKGYQISQYDLPLAFNGHLTITLKNQSRSIRINRVHLEEDTAKLIHKKIGGRPATLIDFNRAGVPLVEIVTEPDIHSAEEAVAYLKKLQQIIRYLKISDCDMEKGSMRCEANISLAPSLNGQPPKKLPGYKVEVKNINSFRFVKKAIEYEIQRQAQLITAGQTPFQETRGYHEASAKTVPQRTKEGAADYRYFPEPDIPPLHLTSAYIQKIKALLPELPDEKQARFIKEYQLSSDQAALLVTNQQKADYFEKLVKAGKKYQLSPAKLANLLIHKKFDWQKTAPADLCQTLARQQANQVSDQQQVARWVTQAIKANPQAVTDFKKGKQAALGFLVGQVMKLSQGRADPQLTRRLLLQSLK